MGKTKKLRKPSDNNSEKILRDGYGAWISNPNQAVRKAAQENIDIFIANLSEQNLPIGSKHRRRRMSDKITLPCTPIIEAEFDLGALAGWLAFQSDIVQATFFNKFATQLRRACDIRNGSLGISMQCMRISKHLSNDAAHTLTDIGNKELEG